MEERLKQLEQMLRDPKSAIYFDILLDIMDALVRDMDYPELHKNKNFAVFLSRFKEITREVKELRIKLDDFVMLKLIGKGGYGAVQLVKHKASQKVYAMKTLSKVKMLNHRDSALFWEERNIMAFAKSPWIPQLFCSFQDERGLYMVMDYVPGGSLHSLFSRHKITDLWGKFYVAEVVLAVNTVHSLGFIHRDIKPENFLLDHGGHLKLADFGMAVKMDEYGFVHFNQAMGTTHYMAPELLKTQHPIECYGREVDWWSVGVLIFKMLVGYYPFNADNVMETKQIIREYRENLKFPSDVNISNEAKSLICSFLTESTGRLGRDGIKKIMQHSFFRNTQWNWNTIRETTAPVIPLLESTSDTKYFEAAGKFEVEAFPEATIFIGNQLPFVGFTCLKDDHFVISTSTEDQGTLLKREDNVLRKELQHLKAQYSKEVQLRNDLLHKNRVANGRLLNTTKKLEEERRMSTQMLKLEESRRKGLEQQMESELRKLRDKCMFLQTHKQKMENHMEETIEKNVQKEISGLQNKLTQLTMDQSKAQHDNIKLQEKLDNLQREKAHKESEMASKIYELQQRLQQQTRTLDAFEDEQKRKNRSPYTSDRSVKMRLSHSTDGSKAENIRLQGKLTNLEKKFEMERAAHMDTEDELTKLKDFNERVTTSLREVERKMLQYELENSRLSCELKQALQKVVENRMHQKEKRMGQESQTALNELLQKYEEEKASHRITKKQLDELININKSMKESMRKLDEELYSTLHQDLQHKLMKMEAERQKYSAKEEPVSHSDRVTEEKQTDHSLHEVERPMSQVEIQMDQEDIQSPVRGDHQLSMPSPVGMDISIDYMIDLSPPEIELEDCLFLSGTNNTRNPCWERKFVVVSTVKISFYNSIQDRHQSRPFMEFETNDLLQVRHVSFLELEYVDTSELPCIFLVFYSKKLQIKPKPTREDPNSTIKFCLGHEFIPSFFHGPTDCAYCSTPLWHLLRPPHAMRCRRCNVTLHKSHVEKKRNLIIAPCKAKKLMLMAASKEKQKRWIRLLNGKIAKKTKLFPSKQERPRFCASDIQYGRD